MSVQPVPSVPVATEPGAVRKRPAGTERARGDAPFALPEQGSAMPRETAKPGPASEGRNLDTRTRIREADAADASSKTGKPQTEVGEASVAIADMVVPESGAAVAVPPPVIVAASAQSVQNAVHEPAAAPVLPAAAPLLAEALTIEADAVVAPGEDTAAEAGATPPAEAFAPVLEPTAAAPPPVAEPAPAPVLADPSSFVLFAALATSEPMPAVAAPPSAEPASPAASAIAAPAPAESAPVPVAVTAAPAGSVPATSGTPVSEAPRAQMLPLPGGASDAAESVPAPETRPDAEVTQLASRFAGLGVQEGPARGAVKEEAPRPEFKMPEALQPAQGGIEFTPVPHGRHAVPEGLQAPQIVEHAAGSAQPATTSAPTPLHVVPIEIGLRALAGGRNFDIRLDPAELGRVDVSLKISDEGEVTAKLVVDRVETLHLLQRDARTLERAFEQAGLKPSNAGVDISLRDPGDQSGFRQQRQQDEAPRRAPSLPDIAEDSGLGLHPAQPATVRGLVRLGGVDLSI